MKIYIESSDKDVDISGNATIYTLRGQKYADLVFNLTNERASADLSKLSPVVVAQSQVKLLSASASYSYVADGDKGVVFVKTSAGNTVATLPISGDLTTPVIQFSDTTTLLIVNEETNHIFTSDGADLSALPPPSSVSSSTININAPGLDDAAMGNKDFIVHLGSSSYKHEISNFDVGDTISFPKGQTPTLNNVSFDDNKVNLQYASGGAVVTIELTGLPTDTDSSLAYISSFKNAFGISSITSF